MSRPRKGSVKECKKFSIHCSKVFSKVKFSDRITEGKQDKTKYPPDIRSDAHENLKKEELPVKHVPNSIRSGTLKNCYTVIRLIKGMLQLNNIVFVR